MSNISVAVFLDRTTELLRQDWRKTTAAGGAFILLLIFTCRLVLRAPGAAPAAVFPFTAADNQIGLSNPPAPISSSEAINQWFKQPIEPAKRNIFDLNLEDYPTDALPSPGGNNRILDEQQSQMLWDDVAKSLAAKADHRRERELRLKNLQRSASNLTLQQIFAGPPAKARVNGEMVDAGSVIASFRIVRIESDRIIVEKDGMTLVVTAH